MASFGDVDSVSDAIIEAYGLDVVSNQKEEYEQEKFMTLVESVLGKE